MHALSKVELADYVNDVLFMNDRFNAEEDRVQHLLSPIDFTERECARYMNVQKRAVKSPERPNVRQQFKIVSKHGLPTISIVQHLGGYWSIALLQDAESEMVALSLPSVFAAFVLAHTVADSMTAHRKLSN